MATTKKVVKKTSKSAVKKIAIKKVAKAKSVVKKNPVKKVSIRTETQSEKLHRVLYLCEEKIFDIIRDQLQKEFNSNPNEFDGLIEWLDSPVGAAFISENELISAQIVNDLLQRAIGQFEVDSWNESHASLTKTASYVFDSSFTLFD